MDWLMPEPACDIHAQVAALLDPRHPKEAVFAAPGNAGDLPTIVPDYLEKAPRREGTLVARRGSLARDMFREAMPNDEGMAMILGYPEPKDHAIAACPPAFLRVVQACDWRGDVITEALCSPEWIGRTWEALAPHGRLRVLTVADAIARRIALRASTRLSA